LLNVISANDKCRQFSSESNELDRQLPVFVRNNDFYDMFIFLISRLQIFYIEVRDTCL